MKGSKLRSYIHEMCEYMQNLEEKYPGVTSFNMTLNMMSVARSMNGEQLTPGDVLSAAKQCFKDEKQAREYWWPIQAQVIKNNMKVVE